MPHGGPSRLSFRRLLVLVRGLPPGSAVQASLAGAIADSQASALKSRRDHYAHLRAEQEGVGRD